MKKIYALFLLFSFFGIIKAFAQSDGCSGAATLLTPGATCTNTAGNTTTGYTNSGVGCSNGNRDDDGWYRFVATATTHTVTVDGGAGFDAVVACWTSCAGTTAVSGGTCTDATGGNGIETLNLSGLTIGTTYFIQVYDFGAGGAGFDICITSPPAAPANDDPSGAIAITPSASCSYSTYTNANATASTCGTIPVPGCSSYSGGDVWFSVVVPATTGFAIDTQTGTVTDGGMAVYSGTPCGAMTLISCDDDGSANGLMPTLTVTGQTPGTTLYIRFWEYSNDNNGTFGICVTNIPTPPAAPANDNCPGAIALTPSTTCTSTSGTITGATQSLVGCSGTANDDVWYSFVAASTTQTINLTPAAGFDPVVQVFSGSCASLSSLTCSDGGFPTGTAGSITQTGLTVGQTYYYRVYDYYSTNPTNTTFTTCVTTPPPIPSCIGNSPPGETCAIATPICDLDGYCGSTSGYTVDTWGALTTGFCGSIENNSWLSFVASSTSISFNVWVTSSTMGYGIQIYIVQVPTCGSGAITGYTCFNPGTANIGASSAINATGLTPGQKYYIMIDGNSGDICNYVIGANSGVNVPVAVTPSTPSVCQGVPVSLTASGGNGTYTWSPAGGLSATSGTTVTATQAAVGTYTYTATSSTGNPACPSSTTASATLTVTNCSCTTLAANTGPVCTGSNFNLTASSAGAGYSYAWTGSGGYTSNVQNPPAITASATAGTYTYTVTATSGTLTCSSTTTVTVNPRPTMPAPANIVACAGDVIPATALSSVPAGATYTWTNSNTAVGLAASGTGNVSGFTASNATGAAITSTVTITPSLGSCAGTPVTFTITVNPQPTAPFTSPANQCLNGNTFNFTNTGTAGGVHGWTFPSGTPATSASVSPTGVTWATAGTYTVTHTVTLGTCVATSSVTITVYPRPTPPGLTGTDPTCGNSNGQITVTAATGGTGALTYDLNGGAATALTNYTGQAPGTYTVNVTDVNGCKNNATVTLTNIAGPTAIATTIGTAHCAQSDGSITLGAVTGGTSTFTYSVTPVVGFSGTTAYTGLATGTHTITVKDFNNCTYTTTVNVPNAAGPVGPNATPANSTCGNSNGSVTLAPPTTPTAGASSYTYSFNGSSFTATTSYNSLAAGTYTYVTKDNFGCTVNGTVTVNNSAGPTAVVLTPVNSTCGAANGSFTIGAVTGGTGAITYSVSPGPAGFNSTTSFTGLSAATYTVIVKDVNGCTYTSNTTVSNTGAATAVVLTPVNSNCGANNGSFTIGAVTGGVGAFTYSVSPGPAGFNSTTSFTGLAANTYTVIVKGSNGCTFTSNTTVGNNPGPTAVVLTPVDATCGLSNGSYTIGAVTGGGGTNTYSVSPGPAGFNSTTSFTGLAPNTYTVIVKDVNGCTFTSNTTIGNIAGPTAVVLTPANSTCGNANGSFTIGAVTGGTGVMTYSVAPGPAGFTGTTSYSSLAAGTFTVTVKDANNCTFVANTTVANTAGPTAVALTPLNTSCGGTTGTLTIGAVTGGTSAYTYSVSPGPAGFNATTSFTNLGAATYTVIVKDANNCQFTQTSVVGNNPGPTAVVLTPASATCGASNGSFTIGAVTGGTAGFTYSVNGSGFTGTTSYTGLAAATYTVIVQDVNNCQFTANTTVPNSGGPTAVVLTPVDATCGSANGSFTIGAVTGGAGGNTYSVNGSGFTGTTNYTTLTAGTYTVIVKDANNCTYTTTTAISNSGGPTAQAMSSTNSACSTNTGTVTFGATTGGTGIMTYSFNGSAFTGTTVYTNVAAGTYNAIVKDGNNCQFATTVTVGTVAGPTAVVLTPTNSTCGSANGSFVIGAVTGGTSAYTYSINGGAFTGTTSYASQLAATYTVVVSDANGCTFTSNVTVANTPGPTAFAVSSTNSTCGNSNGVAIAGAVTTSGSTTYQYSINGGALGATTSFTGLAAATYTLLVQDANGCQLTNTVTVANTPGPTAQVLTPVNSTCGNANGTVTIGATTGGTGLITYSFNGGAFSGTTNYASLAAGTYTVVAQDANNCQFTQTTVVSNLPGPTAIALTTVSATCGGSNGVVNVGVVTGGSGTNTYSFNGSPFTATTSYTGLIAGTYTVVVQDVNLCQFTQTVAVNNSGGPTAVVLTPTNSTCGNPNGSIAVGAVTGGAGTITYALNGGAYSSTTNYTGLVSGTYTISVSDVNACTFSQTVTINNTAGPAAVVLTPTNSTCGNANGSFTIGAVTGGTGAMTYSINGGAFTGTTSYTSQSAATYTVVVKDANGCTFTSNVTVANTPGPTAFAVSSVSSTCGNSNGVANAGAVTTSGSTTYQYSINGGALGATTSFTGLAAATYTLLVQDANGCQLTNTVVVTNLAGPTAQILTPTNATCGNPNGVVTIGATTGGNGLITYNFNGGAFSGTTSYSGLTAGTYTVIAQDANNCQFTQTTIVSNLAGPTAIALTPTNATCGGSNGAVTIGAVTGGSGTNTFSFNGSPFTATTSYPGLIAGTYTVIVQDVNLCQFTQTVAVNNSGGPTAVVVTPTNSTCGNPNGSIAIGAVTGGAGTINYSLNGGALSTTTSYTGLLAGTYTVLVSDVNACTFSQTVTVNNTAGPTAVAITPVNSTCGASNGTLTIGAVTGGTSGFTYSMNGSAFTGSVSYTALLAGTYTIVVQDANNCQFTQTAVILDIPGPTSLVLTPTNSTCGNPNGSIALGAVTGGTSPYQYSLNNAVFVASGPYTGLTAATYTVVIKDANLCTYTVTTNVADTPGPTAQAATTTNSTCGNPNGVVTIGATTGGTAPYQYSFDSGVLSATVSYTTTAGTHTVLVSDANLCTYTVTTIVNNTAGPSAIALSSTPTNCGNSNGVINVGVITGGTSPFEYSIDGGLSYQAVTSFPGLLANTYTITVKDANNCTLTNTVTVSNLSSPAVVITAQTNVSCNGGNNGTATLAGSGGASPYVFTLNTGQTNGSGVFNGLTANVYTVTITDAASCTSTSTFTISQTSTLVGSILSQTNVSCFAGTNGSVTVTETGGTAPYTYAINGGAFGATPTFGTLSATDYTVTVSDNLGCTANVPVTITQPTQISLTMSSTNANCTDDNGTASVVASGGTPGYIYSWTGGGGNASTTIPVVAGDYTVTVRDANACPTTGIVTIGITPGGVATISNITNVSCFGGSNGSLTVSMGGGATAPFTYVWSPNVGTTATVSNLPIGTYSVTVTDVHGCIASTNGAIAEPVALALNFTSTNVSCNAGSDGTISSIVTGGRTPYSYSWSPGAFNTGIVSGLPAGTYSLLVTDDNGCTVTGTRAIVQPTALTITPTITNPHCNQADGSASVVGGGGAGGYTFSLNGGSFGAGSFNSLLAGTYTVTIKDGNQCTTNLPLTLVDQAGPSATITASTNVSCNGGSNGSATVSASGGTTPYFYAWNPSGQTTQTANNLNAGVYGVTVTDATGCVAAASIIITQPSTLTINATGTDPVCNGQTNGTGTSSAFGGTTPYAYQWAVLPIQATANASGLPAGTHVVTVTDALGCTASTSITLNNPALLTATINRTNLLCNNICNGTATAVTTNGTGPFAYTWNDANAQTTQTATGLCAGNYTVNIVDFKGCTATAATTLTEPSLLVSSIINPVNVTCAGLCNGSGSVNASGGVAPYIYSWSNLVSTPTNNNLCVGSYTANVIDVNGCETQSVLTIVAPNPLVVSASSTNASCNNVCDGTATATFSGGTAPYSFLWQPSLSSAFNPTALCDGTHTVTITDANGCTQTASTTITEPAPLLASTIVNGNNFCGQSNGSAQVQVTGGTSPFSYVWTNGSTSSFNSGLAGGVYAVDVTDGNGCTVNAVANVNDIPAPTLTLNSSTNISCFGLNNGIAVLGIAGGTTPYSSQTWLMPITLIPNANQAGTGLWPGNNVFQIVDAAGCISSITVPITEPTQLVSAVNAVVDVTCNGFNDGTATMLVNGGTTPYSYAWTDAALQTNPTASNLAAGTYNCNVTDGNGCATSQTVVIDEPLPLAVIINSITHIDCFGANNGSLSITPFGGTPSYTYAWTPSVGAGPVITNLQPGAYSLLLTDNKGCTTTYVNTITEPSAFTVVSNVQPSTCSDPNASIGLLVSGASAPYTFQWNDAALQTNSTAQGLVAPGAYSCVITDSHGCTTSITEVTTDLPPPMISNIAVTNVNCYGGQDGTLTVTAQSGGSSSYTYQWYNSSNVVIGNGSFQGGLPIGTYQIIVTDANGCTVNGSASISQPFPLTVNVSQDQIACNGQVLGIYASAANGTPPYVYTWGGAGTGLNGGGNHNVTYANTNNTSIIQNYTVSVTDAHNCPAVSGQFNVTVLPKISIISNDVVGCLTDNVTLDAIAGGGDGAPYTFTWGTSPTQVTTGATSSISVPVTSLFPVSYNLTVSDGCSSQETVIVNVSANPKPVASIVGFNTIGCPDLLVNFSAGNPGTGINNPTYSWNFGDNSGAGSGATINHTFTNSTTQTITFDLELTVTSDQGCVDTQTQTAYVTVYPSPVAEFTFNPTEISEFEPTVNFYNQSLLGDTYNWNFGDATSLSNLSTDENPIHVYADPGMYNVNLLVTSTFGCTDTVSHSLYVTPEFALYVPNAFSPTGDHKNEIFTPQGIGIDEERYNMYIYNRWGELIYQTNNFQKGWDGKVDGNVVQIDTYVYKIIVYDLNSEKHVLTGHVTVVR